MSSPTHHSTGPARKAAQAGEFKRYAFSSEKMSFEQEMEEELLTDESELEFFNRHVELYEKSLCELHGLDDEKARYFEMPRAALATYMLGYFEDAERLAIELTELKKKYPGTWNDGNAVFYANWVRGMIEFDKGDIEKAKEYLLLSGACGGSPQLNSFGPNMRLAKRFLRMGEKELFLEFLSLIERFWTSGKGWLGVWRSMVNDNKMPNCLMHIF